MKRNLILLLLAISVLSISCFEDMDDKIRTASNLDIQNFVYRGMNYYYLYKADTPELANDAFASDDERDAFLNNFDSPESLFEYLKSSQDEFSRIYPDYRVIEDALSGVSLSNGMEFGLVYYPNSNNDVFGYVRYVLPNSDAQTKGIQRGDLFTTVDGVQLNSSNYQELLANNSYKIGLATYDGSAFTSTGQDIVLNKSQIDENPVYLAKTLDINGRKVGYVMYNSFTRRYDSELNNAFAQLKSEGATELVLDLRYNGGGSVETATDLASMITGQFNGDIFYQQFWNEDRQEEKAKNGLFDDKISNGSLINSLNLSRVYILTTTSTASASELVINGLNPYITTVQIGDTTRGKFQASVLLYDAPAPDFSGQYASMDHRYAMLPLVYKSANSAGFTDFVDGLYPQINIRENYFNLGELGNPEEAFLATALAEITSGPRPAERQYQNLKEISNSKEDSPVNGVMLTAETRD